jgi:hypothetical protein
MRAALIDNFQRHAVLNGLTHRVFVDVIAEHALSFVDGRAGIGNAGGMWDRFVEICSEQGVLRAMRFIRHHQNILAFIEFREGFG